MRGQEGPIGPVGLMGRQWVPGFQGLPGPRGTPGISGLEIVESQQVLSVARDWVGGFLANCPAGKEVIGGGGAVISTPTNSAVVMVIREPASDAPATSWFAAFANTTNVTHQSHFIVTAMCAFV